MQRADKRNYHYIYKITRDDGYYYLGMHSTDNLEDGYFGSGKRITRSIKKHGLSKHTKQILEFCSSRQLLKEREKQLLTEDIRNDLLCMNIAPGGGGGFVGDDARIKCQIAGNKSPNRDHAAAAKKSNATKRARGILPFGGHGLSSFSGKKHRDETVEKIKLSLRGKQSGEKNSQFGTCWITDGTKTIKIQKDQLGSYVSCGFSKGRKLVSVR